MTGTLRARLGPEDLRRMRANFLQKHPAAREHAVAVILGVGICVELLGIPWAKKNIDTARPPSADYFPRLRAPEDGEAHILWEHRVIDLGRLLYEGQDLDGFAQSLNELRKRSLRGVAAELRVAHLLVGSGHHPRLVQRTGEKGRDYDIEVSVGRDVVPVEVKAKEEGTPLNEGTILATMRDARKQLPKDGPGVIVLALPGSWTSGPQVDAQAVDAVVKGLRNSKRVNAVVLLWEAMLQVEPQGRAFATCFLPIHNPTPRTPIENIGVLLRALVAGDSAQLGPASLLKHLQAG